MIKIDFWNKYRIKDANGIITSFYPNSGLYAGNLLKDNIPFADFVSNDSLEIEKKFKSVYKRMELKNND